MPGDCADAVCADGSMAVAKVSAATVSERTMNLVSMLGLPVSHSQHQWRCCGTMDSSHLTVLIGEVFRSASWPHKARHGLLLPHHHQLEPLLRADQVVDVLRRRVNVDLHPVDLAGEGIPARAIILRDRLAHIAANVH